MDRQPLAPGYARFPFKQDERVLVRSVCNQCGTELIGSFVEDLELMENTHRKLCDAVARASGAST